LHWWYAKKLSKELVKKLGRAGTYVLEEQHRAVNGVYSARPMVYLRPMDESLFYRFTPQQQFQVEQLLVEHWDSILAMLVAFNKKEAAVDFDDDDVRGAVLKPFRTLLALVDPTRPCKTGTDFAAAVEWLIQKKELPLLRAHVCGDEPGDVERGPTRWSRDGPVVFQLATALPDGARGWWYSKETLLAQFIRRGADDATADDLALCFATYASPARVAKEMRLRHAQEKSFLWIPSSSKVTPHSILSQLSGDVHRPDDYSDADYFPRLPLREWSDWKASRAPVTPTAGPVEEQSAPATAALPTTTTPAELMKEIAALDGVAPWLHVESSEDDAVFAIGIQERSLPERFARFGVDAGFVYFAVHLGGRPVPCDDAQLADLKSITTVDEARGALATAAELKACRGFTVADLRNDETKCLGFRVAVSTACRNAGKLERGERALCLPDVGALLGKKTTKRKRLRAVEEGDGDGGGPADESGVVDDSDDDELEDDDLEASGPRPDMASSPLKRNRATDFDAAVRAEVAATPLTMVLEQRGDSDYAFRSAGCAITGGAKGGRCESCRSLSSWFHTKLSRLVETREKGPHKNAPHTSFAESPGQVTKVLRRNATELKELKRKLRVLAARERQSNGVVVEDVEQHRRLSSLFESANGKAMELFPEDSVARAVWQDQLENCHRAARHGGKKTACRYSPATIKVAIALCAKLGKSTYDEVRKLFLLPTGRHLQNYSNFGADDAEGVMVAMLRAMREKAVAARAGRWDRCGAVTFDAMSVKGGVFFDYHTGRLLGFAYDDHLYDTVLSDFRSHAQSLQDKGAAHAPEPAKHYLVYYFVGLGEIKFAFPVARFALTSIKAANLAGIFNSVVIELARHSFRVIAAVFDGAQENRSFHKLHAKRSASEFLDGVDVNWDGSFLVAMDHPVFGSEWPIFFLSDTPHGVKKVVNALESSNAGNNKKRQLQHHDSDGNLRPLSLKMCEDVWLDYEGQTSESAVCGEAPLKLTKLTRDHFNKNAFSRMRVPLAAQVVSNTMCGMIDDVTAGSSEKQLLYQPLRRLCAEMNRFLDIMNGRQEKEYGNIASVDAKELKELNEIMVWFESWYQSIQNNPSFTDADAKKSAFLPEECWYDLQSIIKGVTALSVFYHRKFDGAGITIVQRRLMQDIVEHHFAHVRQSCGASNQPTQAQAHRATSTAGTLRLYCGGKGNCSAAPTMDIDPHAPLLKRK